MTGNATYGDMHLSDSERLFQRSRLAVFAGLLTLILTVWGCFLVRQDSHRRVYQGKPLTRWLQTYTSSARGSPEWKEADMVASIHRRVITTHSVQVRMMAKRAMSRLRRQSLISEHLPYACLRLHDQRHRDLCRDLPVTERAHAEATQHRHYMTGSDSLMRALLSERVGRLRSLLDATRFATYQTSLARRQ